jgi:hypothetical protein
MLCLAKNFAVALKPFTVKRIHYKKGKAIPVTGRGGP